MTKKAFGNRDGRPTVKQRTQPPPELDRRPIVFTPEEIAAVRSLAAANSKGSTLTERAEDARNLLEHLGLMPGTDWYKESEHGDDAQE